MKKRHESIETTSKYLKNDKKDTELSVLKNRLSTIAGALETGQWTTGDAIEELRMLSE